MEIRREDGCGDVITNRAVHFMPHRLAGIVAAFIFVSFIDFVEILTGIAVTTLASHDRRPEVGGVDRFRGSVAGWANHLVVYLVATIILVLFHSAVPPSLP